MPEISRFFGIVIAMNFDDHLPPHFHAVYAEHEASVAIVDLAPETLIWDGPDPADVSRRPEPFLRPQPPPR
jgi:hypothetical protein